MTTNQEGVGDGTAQPMITAFTCPVCGWSGEFDTRFTLWCESCGHNAEAKSDKPEKARAARRRARARARAEKQLGQLVAAQDLRPTSGPAAAVVAASAFVHLITAALLAASVIVIATLHEFWFEPVLGVLGVLMAVVVRPRLWKALRKPRDLGAAITRDKAPQLFALLESSAAQINAPVPDYVYLDGQFNASTYRIGFKRETVLTIGLPLWESLSEQERVALLGHELAHQVNGDVTRGILVGCARRSLVEWLRMLNPRQSGHERWMARRLQRNSGPAYALALVLTPLVTIAVFGPPFLLALGCYAILNRFDLTNSKRAEYLADELGARLGSSAAALGLMERIALYESVRYFISREKSARFTGDLWPALRQYLDSIPDHEKRRRVRLDELHGTSVDSGHPANYLRHRLLAARPQQAGAIRPGTVDWSAIDAELTPYSRALARRLLGQRQGTTTRTGQSGAAAQSSPSS